MITVILPSYNSKDHIMEVLSKIPSSVTRIIVVDDACPIKTGEHVEKHSDDPRVAVIYHAENQGVGGAMISGYREALNGTEEYFVKIDSDGQMDPAEIDRFVAPIKAEQADYTKGNRFHYLELLQGMPPIRILGNSALSFFSKASSGYWDIMDPTNGFTAIHRKVIAQLPLEKISRRYFFESDMLFRLNICRAKVMDIPLKATYGEEESGLNIRSTIFTFTKSHCKRIFKRLFYSYFLRDFNPGSFFLIFSFATLLCGMIYGSIHWAINSAEGTPTPTGTIVITSILIITGFNFLANFFNYDTSNKPSHSIHPLL